MRTKSQFLAMEREREERIAHIEQEIDSLTSPGQEFDPWAFDHFTEAVENAELTPRRIIYATVSAAIVDLDLKNSLANYLALNSIKTLVQDYWREAAQVAVLRRINNS